MSTGPQQGSDEAERGTQYQVGRPALTWDNHVEKAKYSKEEESHEGDEADTCQQPVDDATRGCEGGLGGYGPDAVHDLDDTVRSGNRPVAAFV
jgi:hypothetical protein|tara:strand:+ start:21267 stop:21545 length:279 start_codon:yes stop_codon:yes gene_type:complete